MREELIEAINRDDSVQVKDLLSKGANPAESSAPGANDSPVYQAANEGKMTLLPLLVDAWERIEPGVITDSDILWHCLYTGQVEAGRFLSTRGASTPFPMAVALGDLERASRCFDGEDRLLGEDGSPMSKDAETREFNCAFFYSALCGTTAGMDFALSRITGIDMQPPGSDFGGVSATAMHWAASNGKADAVEWLLARGADPTIRDDEWNGTPVGWAREGGFENVLDVFRKHSESLDPQDREMLEAGDG